MSTSSLPVSPKTTSAPLIFNRIFVPLDGSPRAEQAISVAARLARMAHGTVILAQVIHLPYEYSLAPFSYPISDHLYDRERLDASAYLAQVAALPALSGVPVEKLVLDGVVGPALLDAIETSRAECVVITTHGRTGVSRWTLGSVAEQLARLSSAPTLVLPDSADMFGELPPSQLAPSAQHPLRLLVPLDGSPLAEAAMTPAAQLLLALMASGEGRPTHTANTTTTNAKVDTARLAPAGEIHLLMALAPGFMTANIAPEAMIREGAQAYLEKIARDLREQYPQIGVTWSLASTGDAAEGIAQAAGASREHDTPDYAYDEGYAAIVMASRGRTGFARWALGSVAERVLRLTRRPILIVRPLAQRPHDKTVEPLHRTAPLTHHHSETEPAEAEVHATHSDRRPTSLDDGMFGMPLF